ncbi:hypothetical protein HMPREF9373_2314 [Psychrobacter sp. 1501(2011)]|nr:hypothetical protein HMPREF9373_2314 [Psychrobacter sp. 1501(2011)]
MSISLTALLSFLIEPYVIAIDIMGVNNNKMEAIRTHTAGLT